MSDSLYRANLLDHYEHPHHYGTLDHPTHQTEGANLSCGDELSISAVIKNGIIDQVAFTARACVVCTASASMLLEQVAGKPLAEATALTVNDITQNLGIELSPIRLKCALLPLETLKNLETVARPPAA